VFRNNSSKVLVVLGFAMFGLVAPIVLSLLGLNNIPNIKELASSVLGVIVWVTWPTCYLGYLSLGKMSDFVSSNLSLIVYGANSLFWFTVGLFVVSTSKWPNATRWLASIGFYVFLFGLFNYLLLCSYGECANNQNLLIFFCCCW